MSRALSIMMLAWGGWFSAFAGLDDLEDVNFPLNSSVVVDAFQGLDMLAAVMAKHPDLELEVVGHTDSLGSQNYNNRLSQRRADNVKTYLVSKGVRDSQITTRGDGIARNYDNSSREGRFQNRRVDLLLFETVNGVRSKVSHERLLELFFGGRGSNGMVGLTSSGDGDNPIMMKLTDLERQISALEGRLNDAMKGTATTTTSTGEKLPAASLSGYVPLGGYSGVGFGIGADDEGDFAARAEGLWFKRVNENFGVQAQGDFAYYDTREEGQLDLGFVYQNGGFKIGAAGSYKMASLGAGFETARMGQGSVVADFMFNNGQIGLFGTVPFADGDVIAETTAGAVSSAFVVEQYVSVPAQYGLNFGFNLGQRATLNGYLSSIDTEVSDADLGAGLNLNVSVRDFLSWYLEAEQNQSLLDIKDDGRRYLTGLRFGSWSQVRYGRSDDITPINIPRIRYEILSRQVRRGNTAPSAVAGPSRSGVAAGNIVLDGSGSSDPDGDALTYKWVQTDGPPVELMNANTAVANFTGVAGEAYTFQLQVTDSFGEAASDIIRITMEAAPDPGSEILFFSATPSNIDQGQLATLSWATANADTVTMSGVEAQAVQVGADGSIIVAPQADTTYTLTATNGVNSVTQSVTITVNVPVTPQPTVSFFSAVPDRIFEGSFTTLSWSTSDADNVEITGLGQVSAEGSLILSPEQTTTYTLTATNTAGSATASVTVTVDPPNGPPTANAGADIFVRQPTMVTLNGTASADPEGQPLIYQWTQTSGIPVTLTGADTATPSFMAERGSYFFKLTVTDDKGQSDTDQTKVFVVRFKADNKSE